MKVEVDLTEMELAFLKQYAELYSAEREIDVTVDPIIVVERRCSILTEDGGSTTDGYEYSVNSETAFSTWKEVEEYLEESVLFDELITIEKKPVFYVWEPVAYFLTRKEAENYCEYQKHILGVHRVFTRNVGCANASSLPELMGLLRRLGGQLQMGDSDVKD